MAQQTAMQILWDWIDANCHEDNFNINDARDMSLNLEKQQIKDAVIYGLDEDGHTGDWKISVAEGYYNKTYNTQGNE